MSASSTIPIELHPVGSKNLLVPLKRFDQRRHKLLVESHVVVHEKQQVTLGNCGASVQCRREARILFESKPAHIITFGYIRGVVRRAIINNDNLERRKRLRQKTWQTDAKVLCAVPIHNDYRHPGIFGHDYVECSWK